MPRALPAAAAPAPALSSRLQGGPGDPLVPTVTFRHPPGAGATMAEFLPPRLPELPETRPRVCGFSECGDLEEMLAGAGVPRHKGPKLCLVRGWELAQGWPGALPAAPLVCE